MPGSSALSEDFKRVDSIGIPQSNGWNTAGRNPMACGKLDFRLAFNYAMLNVGRPFLDRMFRDCSKALESYVDQRTLDKISQ